ncbi:MAG: NAD(P)/FAD-dependent oxidoreductase [Anaerolineales bacterium]|nr:NAD(P)/FAD-dependent oxidoreductase [Anaerolineales bacterium]
MKIAVIGSGVAGLTAAATLAQAGHQVTVFEQYPRAGGVTAPLEREGFKWDLGQLILEGLGPGEPLGLILEQLGVADKIHLRVEDRGYVFPDFELRKPEQYQGARWRIERLKQLFPQDAAGLDRYWRDYVRFAGLMTMARRMDRASGLSRLYWQARLYLKLLPFLSRARWSAQRLMDNYFQSPELQAVFISILADFTTPPSKFPGLGVFSLNPETVYDKRMPRALAKDAEQLYHYSILGGISTLVDTLVEKIESHGGRVLVNSPVTRVLVEAGGVKGLVAGGEQEFPAQVVIASGGAKETFFGLVGEAHLPADFIEKVNNLPLMESIFMVHLGVDFDPSPYLHGPVTYFYGTYDIEGGVAEMADGVYHEGAKGFVVHVPSLHSPEMAPPGYHAMTIYTIAPDQLKQGSWQERREEYADKLISYAEKYIPALSEHVKVCEILTPEDFRQRTHLEHHAFGGIAPLMDTPRIPHRTPIQGLWFVGAQSESGGGVNNVIPAAYKTARAIAAER